jgi:hypothetical protein
MRYAYLRLFAASAFASGLFPVAQAAPVANLPLTCPNAAAIGQPQNNCSGFVYRQPSCRDASGVRRIVYLAKRQVLRDALFSMVTE